MIENKHVGETHDTELASAVALAREARQQQTKLPPDSIPPSTIVKMANLAVEKGDARDLEPILTMLGEKERALEANLGLSEGQLTNNPELTDLRALREGVEKRRKDAWDVQGIRGAASQYGVE